VAKTNVFTDDIDNRNGFGAGYAAYDSDWDWSNISTVPLRNQGDACVSSQL
jgi:hypothetical protein